MQHFDFSNVLPRFLSLYVFSFLHPKTLSKCSQVSWHWKFLTEQASGMAVEIRHLLHITSYLCNSLLTFSLDLCIYVIYLCLFYDIHVI